jgi:putative flippase GtrA
MLVYAAVGLVGTAAHYALLIALVDLLHADAATASTLGFLAGALINYGLHRRVTFSSRRRHGQALPRFFATATAGLAFNAGVMLAGVRWMQFHYLIVQVVATAAVLLAGFALNRHWSFAVRDDCGRPT